MFYAVIPNTFDDDDDETPSTCEIKDDEKKILQVIWRMGRIYRSILLEKEKKLKGVTMID